jgi:pimeloyl-ACP methyl ester carboxylesterase
MVDGSIGDPPRTPLVLVPGLLCDERLWQPQAERLADLADPVIANVIGDGSVSEMARSVLKTAPSAGRFALAGLSMGGYVALEVMRIVPNRVVRLALLDTSARPTPPSRPSHGAS